MLVQGKGKTMNKGTKWSMSMKGLGSHSVETDFCHKSSEEFENELSQRSDTVIFALWKDPSDCKAILKMCGEQE